MTEINKYETILNILKNQTNQKTIQQLEQLLNKVPFFQFYKSILKTDSFTFHAMKHIQLLFIKKGHIYKNIGDPLEGIIILLEGTINLIKNDSTKHKGVIKLQPGDHLYQSEIYKNTQFSQYKVQAITDCNTIFLPFSIIHEISAYGFQYAKYKEEYDYFKVQFPDLQIIELVPILKKVKKEQFLNNTKLYQSGQCADKLYFIIDGEVEMYCENSDGKQQKMTVACNNDSFGEESLSQSTYKYTTKTSQYKSMEAFIDEYYQTYAPNLIKILTVKLSLKESLILKKIKQTQAINYTLPSICNDVLKKPFEQFLHLSSSRQRGQSIKISRALSLHDGGVFNFMELNNPGKNCLRLFEHQINRQLVKEKLGSSQHKNNSAEIQKYWSIVKENKSILPLIK